MARDTVKYVAVRDHLRDRISEMRAGEQIPAEPQLCSEYGVSRITVRRAVDDLIRAGVLVREQGRGTFVTEPDYTEEIRETFAGSVMGFYRQQASLGREVTTKVLQNRVTRNPEAAEALALNPADEVIEIERLRYIGGTLHQHVMTYLKASAYPTVLTHDLSRGSLFEFLEKEYGVHLTRNDLLVRLDYANAHVARVLSVREGDAVLAIDSTVFEAGDSPVAYGVATHTPTYSQMTFSMRNS